jgi:hypothetical protein
MPTDITVTELKETVTVTGGTTSITVTGDSATVSVAATSQPVSVVEENATFTISTMANKADIGLGSVDNTSDADKPVSTATQTALNAKLDKSGGTMTGALTLAANPAASLQAATKGYVDSTVGAISTDNVTEGSTNLYYTTTRVNSAFDTRLATKTTANLTEGSNLYFTTARARASVSATGSIAYNSTTGVISYTGGANPVTTDELPEGTTNKYYTDTRVNSAFDTRLAIKSTSNLNEGTNLYYTSARANTDFDTRLATKATTNLAEGTNLYYTTARANTDFDGRLAIKSTTNLTEGSNLYHTTARARAAISGSTGITYTEGTGAIAVDSTIATKTYADSAAASAAAGVVNSSPATLDTLNELAAALGNDANFATTISTALGNKLDAAGFSSAFTGQLAGKTTTDLAEGTNLYYTNARARGAVSAGTGISYDSATGVITNTITQYTDALARGAISGSTGISYNNTTGVITNTITQYTDSLARASVSAGTGISYSNSTGVITNTITQYTDALARGAISATGSLSYNSSTGVVSYTTPTTDGITEGSTNLYYTNTRARGALSAGTGVTYDNSTGVISIGQAVGTTANPTFGTITANLASNSYVLGALEATTNSSYTFPAPILTTITNNNGLDAASSMPASTNGSGAQQQIIHYYGDTFAGVQTTAALLLRAAPGNSTTSGTVPFTGITPVAPSASAILNTLGTVNYNGYATTGFTDAVASSGQGGGFNANHALQIQGVSAEAFADGTLTITPTSVTRTSATLSSVTVSGTRGQIAFTASSTPSIGQAVLVTGTLSGTATGISAGTYYMVAVSGTTACTLSATVGGSPLTTTAGTTTGLTFARQFITVGYTALSYLPFGLNAKITVTNIDGVTNGTYMATGVASTTTSVSIGVSTTTVPGTFGASPTLTCPTVTAMGSGLRIRAMPLATPANSSNRVEIVNHNATAATYKADTFTISGAAYGTTGTARVTVGSTNTTFALPVVLPNYTAVALRAVTGAVGWLACVNNSAGGSNPNGMMAFWDTTNARWSYIHDNSAV